MLCLRFPLPSPFLSASFSFTFYRGNNNERASRKVAFMDVVEQASKTGRLVKLLLITNKLASGVTFQVPPLNQ
jgi:hypothetical protein